MEWEKQESAGIWLPEKVGDMLVGVVVGVVEGMYGDQHIIEQEDKSEIKTPSHKVLQNRLVKAKKGDQVKVVYAGEEPPAVKGQNPTKMYDVFIKK